MNEPLPSNRPYDLSYAAALIALALAMLGGALVLYYLLDLLLIFFLGVVVAAIPTDQQQLVVSELERTAHMLEQGIAEVETLLPSTTSTEGLHEQTPSPLHMQPIFST